jgi:hypothetical protein
MNMRWAGTTKEDYDKLLDAVRWETDVPDGAMFHVASFTEDGLRVTDVWESADSFDRFVANRLMPGVQQLGIPGQPDVEIAQVHRIFAPNVG